ncbi:MAG TPA: GNAT family N-acetyltransferase [Pyrinomonadaceae bacterium]|nr:GNAT family N-acetyltransferase [Pyrinomonadaceae bacterium]
MAVTFMQQEGVPHAIAQHTPDLLTVAPLTDADELEVLAFLAHEPLHTVVMASFIRDNGLESPLNRGRFYGCRDAHGQLIGVALIGHATLIETNNEAAFASFARLAHNCPAAYLIHGEHGRVARFWRHYEPWGRRPRRIMHELMLEQRPPVAVHEPVRGLRLAESADLDRLVQVNAEMIETECGINPLKRDAIGFRVRLLRRIEQGRVWVWVQHGKLLFKADVVADTPAAVYLEGVWVHPEERRRGYGLRCMSQLGRMLLARTETVCLVVHEDAPAMQDFYRKAGYKPSARYDTIYLQT